MTINDNLLEKYIIHIQEFNENRKKKQLYA